jgi:hypothetical protein
MNSIRQSSIFSGVRVRSLMASRFSRSAIPVMSPAILRSAARSSEGSWTKRGSLWPRLRCIRQLSRRPAFRMGRVCGVSESPPTQGNEHRRRTCERESPPVPCCWFGNSPTCGNHHAGCAPSRSAMPGSEKRPAVPSDGDRSWGISENYSRWMIRLKGMAFVCLHVSIHINPVRTSQKPSRSVILRDPGPSYLSA